MSEIVNLNGQPVQSEAALEEQRKKAIEQFQKIMEEIDKDRIPLDEEDPLEDIHTRMRLIKEAVTATYPHATIKYVGNAAQGRTPQIEAVHQLALLDDRQIAMLGMRLFDLAKKI